MAITVEVVYENGVLKPLQPLPFKEHEIVRVTLQPLTPPPGTSPAEAERAVRRSYGLIGWTGDIETLRRIAEDPEFSVLEGR